MKRAHVFISGKVQGVFFRANTREKAEELGLNGWVKNLSDGRVEAVFEGSEGKVDEALKFCHSGPKRASVEDVEVNWEEPKGIDGFEIRRSLL